jgi:hypothetical protein
MRIDTGIPVRARLAKIFLYRIVRLSLYFRPKPGGEMPIAADEFRAMAAQCHKRANETAELGLRNAYRQLALGYMRLAVQRDAIEHCHALIGRFDAENVASDPRPAGQRLVMP